jgi:tetratricopeptide (TPR) repeat protein
MTFWNFWPFSRRIKVESLTPEQLRTRLVEAAYSGRSNLRRFCQAYKDQIEANIPSLQKGPPGIAERPAEMNHYVQGLGQAAQCLAQECNSPALWNALVGDAESNPLTRWQNFLDAIPERMQRREYNQISKELREYIEEVQSFTGDDARRYEAFFNGRLGDVLFRSGHADEAEPAMRRALSLCREINDRLGIAVYLSNFAEMAKYRGDIRQAVDWLSQFREELQHQGRTSEVPAVDGQLARLQAGEPLCRVMCRDGDQLIELDDLQPVQNKSYKFEFVRNRPSLLLCQQLTREGNEKAAAGELAAALELYQQAAEVDPHDPDPHYQSAAVLMDLGAYDQAALAFAEADRLAPAWFHCRSGRWLAEQTASGQFSSEVWSLLRGLEVGGLPRDIRTNVARQATQLHPDFGGFWLILGDCLREQKEEAERAYLRGLQCADEPDIRSRLLSALIGLQTDGPRCDQWLADLAELDGNLVAKAIARFVAVQRQERR